MCEKGGLRARPPHIFIFCHGTSMSILIDSRDYNRLNAFCEHDEFLEDLALHRAQRGGMSVVLINTIDSRYCTKRWECDFGLSLAIERSSLDAEEMTVDPNEDITPYTFDVIWQCIRERSDPAMVQSVLLRNFIAHHDLMYGNLSMIYSGIIAFKLIGGSHTHVLSTSLLERLPSC